MYHDVHVFDPVALSWTEILPPDANAFAGYPNKWMGLACVRGIMYVFGGNWGYGRVVTNPGVGNDPSLLSVIYEVEYFRLVWP